jgi:mannose-1-phosphate guanylyltransferase
MRAVVLAAGTGARLRPYTDAMPKPMVPVAGRSLLERTVAWLEANGVTEIAVNLHHCPEVVRHHFGERLHYSYEPEPLGTAGALVPLAAWLGRSRFLVLYGDNLIELDLAAMLRLHELERAAMTVALFERNEVSASGVAELVGHRVVSFREKPDPGETDSRLVSAGLLVCEPRVTEFVEPGGVVDFGHDVLPALLVAGEIVAGYVMQPDESLYWIDTPSDLARVDMLLRDRDAR